VPHQVSSVCWRSVLLLPEPHGKLLGAPSPAPGAVERQSEVIWFLAYTGLRWGEMAALRVGDFDMLRRRVSVSRSVTEFKGLVWSTPKTWERRSVPFPASLADELAALMVGRGRDDLVFTSGRGEVLRASNYRRRVFASAVEECRKVDNTFPTITPHDLRHTAASLAVSGSQRESCATDARAREGIHDARRLCRPIRRGSGRRCRTAGHGYPIYCGPAADQLGTLAL
jgi:integrase